MKARRLILLTVCLAGVLVMSYPVFSDYVNRQKASYVLMRPPEIDKASRDAMLLQAQSYNAAGGENMRYDEILDLGQGYMGSLSIPSIQVNLPIYHGTESHTLANAVGHLEGSSLPVGGSGTHCVLTGHTGLPTAKLLTDLVKMQEGDTFSLRILDQTLTYQVDQILVVLPEQTEALSAIPGEDLCTLLTCTPYGINSHRLLVRGSRVNETPESGEEAWSPEQAKLPPQLLIAAGLVALLLAAIFAVAVKKEAR